MESGRIKECHIKVGAAFIIPDSNEDGDVMVTFKTAKRCKVRLSRGLRVTFSRAVNPRNGRWMASDIAIDGAYIDGAYHG